MQTYDLTLVVQAALSAQLRLLAQLLHQAADAPSDNQTLAVQAALGAQLLLLAQLCSIMQRMRRP